MGIIYKVTCPRGLFYIGQCKRHHRKSRRPLKASKQMSLRWGEHCRGSSGCKEIHKAILLNGAGNMHVEILVEVPDTMLDQLERQFIRLYSSTDDRFGYNGTEGGEGGGFAIPEVRERMLKPGSKWRVAQARPDVSASKQAGLNAARRRDPGIEKRRRKNAKAATQTVEYRNETSKRQKLVQNSAATLTKRKATLAKKRALLLASLPPVEREIKRRELEKNAAAQARYKDRKATGVSKAYRKPT